MQDHELAPTVWKSISAIAAERGIRKSAVHKQVERLEREGLIETRREGRSRLVDFVAYQRAIGQVGDAYREIAAETAREIRAESGETRALREAQTQKAQIDTRHRAIDLAERLGNLVPIRGDHGIERASVRACEDLLRAIGQIPAWASDLAHQDEPTVRRELRKKVDGLRRIISAAMEKIAAVGREVEQDGGYDVDIETDEGDR